MASIADLLWRDRTVYAVRTEENAAAWLALADVLRDRRPLDGMEDDFLVLHDRLSAVEPDVLGVVFADPYAHFWLRLAFALVQAVVAGGPLPSEAAAFPP